MRSVPAVGTRVDVSSEPGSAAWPPVAGGAAVREPRAVGRIGLDVSDTIVRPGTEALRACELALKQLAAAPDRPERIARDDESRRVRRDEAAASRSDLLCEGLLDPGVREVGSLRHVRELRACRNSCEEQRENEAAPGHGMPACRTCHG